MRPLFVLTMLVLGTACQSAEAVPADATPTALSGSLPPPQAFALEGTPLMPGEAFTLSAAIPQGATLFLFASPNGAGLGLCGAPGVCLDMDAPNHFLGSATAGPDGLATFTVPGAMTAALSAGQTWYFQAGGALRIGERSARDVLTAAAFLSDSLARPNQGGGRQFQGSRASMSLAGWV